MKNRNTVKDFPICNSFDAFWILGLNTTEEQQSSDNEEKYDLKEIRKRVQEYFIVVRTLSNPRVMKLFQKLNKTLENPDSETKQTVRNNVVIC